MGEICFSTGQTTSKSRFVRGIWAISLLFLAVLLSGCTAGRQATPPEDRENRPAKVAVFPIEPGPYYEAKVPVEKILLELLGQGKAFREIVLPSSPTKGEQDKKKEKLILDYLEKLNILHYSDPDLSRKIGEAWSANVLLIPGIEYWGYSAVGKNTVAKIGLSLILVEAESGKVIWRSVQYITKRYYYFKPPLPEVARDLLKRMLEQMPERPG